MAKSNGKAGAGAEAHLEGEAEPKREDQEETDEEQLTPLPVARIALRRRATPAARPAVGREARSDLTPVSEEIPSDGKPDPGGETD